MKKRWSLIRAAADELKGSVGRLSKSAEKEREGDGGRGESNCLFF
jgi:hypothetical protein